MRNEAGDIVQENAEELKEAAREWKEKAKAVGTAAWDATRATCQQVQDKTIEYSKATDHAIREQPYAAIGISFGLGLVLGLLVAGGKSSEENDKHN